MQGKSYRVLPFGGASQAAIGAALADYHKRLGCYPPSIVVNRGREEAARAVLALAVAELTKAGKAAPATVVDVCGGALLNDLWLEVENAKA